MQVVPGDFLHQQPQNRVWKNCQVDEEVVVAQWGDIIQVMVDRLQRVTTRTGHKMNPGSARWSLGIC